MKLLKLIIGCMLFFTADFSGLCAQEGELIPLPEPRRTGGMPLFEALDNRQSTRSFSDEEVSQQDLSNLLWAAFGVNRDDGRRTAPSARNWQQVDIYLIMESGWYLYEPHQHALVKLGSEDLREHAGGQAFVADSPLNLVFVSDHDRMRGAREEHRAFNSATDVGFISQNVYLFCASEGLATVVRGAIDPERLHRALQLRPAQQVVLAQTVGYHRQ